MSDSERGPVVIREHGVLTTARVERPTPDLHHVSRGDFEHLAGLGNDLVTLCDARTLRWTSFVGVVRTPAGTEIEIHPKIFNGKEEERSRELLARMLESALELSHKEGGEADLRSFTAPLTEWVAGCFLGHLVTLLEKGLRRDYRNEEEELPHLRGRLDVRRQLTQPPHRLHLFHVHHDVFDVEMPENRLLRSALNRVLQCPLGPENWNRAAYARGLMEDVPPSSDIAGDFGQWRSDRLMARYDAVRPWCSLVLGEDMPLAIVGPTPGITLLFPMQTLFERHVASRLKRSLTEGAVLEAKPCPRPLCLDERSGKRLFKMQPDMVITWGRSKWVLDTKWKRMERTDDSDGVSMSDVYQLHAYSRRWIAEEGEAILVYPKHARFPKRTPLPRFEPDGVRLRIAAYDLECDELVFRDGAEAPAFIGRRS